MLQQEQSRNIRKQSSFSGHASITRHAIEIDRERITVKGPDYNRAARVTGRSSVRQGNMILNSGITLGNAG